METTAYRPFETSLPEDEALGVLRSATQGADDGEIFAERRKSEALVFDDGRLRSASYDASEGFGLRAVNGDVAGYAHSTDVSISARPAPRKRRALRWAMAAAPMPNRPHLPTDIFTPTPIRSVPCPFR